MAFKISCQKLKSTVESRVMLALIICYKAYLLSVIKKKEFVEQSKILLT